MRPRFHDGVEVISSAGVRLLFSRLLCIYVVTLAKAAPVIYSTIYEPSPSIHSVVVSNNSDRFSLSLPALSPQRNTDYVIPQFSISVLSRPIYAWCDRRLQTKPCLDSNAVGMAKGRRCACASRFRLCVTSALIKIEPSFPLLSILVFRNLIFNTPTRQ